jgi:nucleotidyltransferase-like protein
MPIDQNIHEAKQDLHALILALEPARDEIVLCGGWAPYLYRFFDRFAAQDHPVLLTTDIDWAVPQKLVTQVSIVGRLEQFKFHALQNREATPPITIYQHERFGSEDPHPVHTEFLAPLRGSQFARSGREKQTVAPQLGLSAVQLRYMDLALQLPETFDASLADLGLPKGSLVRVTHPGNYLVHKALTAPRRNHPDKRDKDLAYIFEVCQISRGNWTWVAERISLLGETSGEFSKWVHDARNLFKEWFTDENSMGPIAVCRVLRSIDPQRTPSEAAVTRVMRRALMELGLFPSR